jgi:CubicO group peptidase (beta-lactamase class C family)
MKKWSLILGVFIGIILIVIYISKTKENFAKQKVVENGLRPKDLMAGDSNRGMNILERMQYYKVPGVSIAVVNDGKIEWAHGYGRITTDPKSSPIDEHTLFQAASISKAITAFGALILVQQGRISLDDDVNLYLKRWKVPENEFTKTEKVTLRRLLSHTAETNVPGFVGYSVQTPIPSDVDVLEGKKPLVNSEPVEVIAKPGTEMKYSGGGITIVQLLIEDITGESFDLWMQNNVLIPLGMSESTFSQPLPSSSALHAAYAHHKNGVKVEGNWHIYPEMGAAGLWTTPTDLARFILYIQSALKGKETKPLDYDYVKEMITREKIGDKESDMGLGIFLINQGKDLIFAHDGQNEGFIARLLGFAFRGQGVAIMMNNDADWNLMEEITNSVADTYKWPDFRPTKKEGEPVSLYLFCK